MKKKEIKEVKEIKDINENEKDKLKKEDEIIADINFIKDILSQFQKYPMLDLLIKFSNIGDNLSKYILFIIQNLNDLKDNKKNIMQMFNSNNLVNKTENENIKEENIIPKLFGVGKNMSYTEHKNQGFSEMDMLNKVRKIVLKTGQKLTNYEKDDEKKTAILNLFEELHKILFGE